MHNITTLENQESFDVLVVGDLMLDVYWSGATARISPEAPVPIVKIESEEKRIGGAGNVALNAAALGSKVALLSLSGTDEYADDIEKILSTHGISSHIVKHQNNTTIRKLRITSRNQQLIRIDFEDKLLKHGHVSLIDKYREIVPYSKLVIISDYAKGTLKDVQSIIEIARANNIPIIVDPKGDNFDIYSGATILTPNFHEFELIVGKCENEEDVIFKGMALLEQLKLDALLVTRSERGMTLFSKKSRPLHLHAQAKEVFDITGAGDTVIAALGSALASGADLEHAVHLSNVAASIVVGKLGASTVSKNELDRELTKDRSLGSNGLRSLAELAEDIKLARSKGERVVMTNGCFDLLHPGHVDYLEKAKALGDRLIVAINDDESVRRLKGETRPVNPIAARVKMLNALQSVDWVVVFSEDTPETLYCTLCPDVLVKGGDYINRDIAGSRCVIAAGGRVELIEFSDGYSTTALIDRISRDVSDK